MNRVLVGLSAMVFLLLLSAPALGRGVPEPYRGCEGPKELCDEVHALREQLQQLEELKEETEAEAEQKDVDLDRKDVEIVQKDVETVQKVEQAKADKEKEVSNSAARSIAIAMAIAIGLRQLLQSIKSWSNFFTTDKAKAWLKVGTIVVGLAAFFATNLGMGIPWWQSLILAGGGPASMAVDGLLKLIPVLLGKKKLSEVEVTDTEAKDPNATP